MRGFAFIAACALGWSVAGLGVAAPAKPAESKPIAVGTRPESVTKGFDGHYFVTIIGDPARVGDGSVKRIAGESAEEFTTGLDNPKGIAFVANHLVIADMKAVWKIDAKGQKSVLAGEKDFPQPVGMLNDVAASPDGNGVIVSDMGAYTKMRNPEGQLWPIDSAEAKALPAIGRIYRVSMDGKVTLLVDANADMPCPNGVTAPDAKTLLIGEFFTGNIIEVRDGKRTILATGYRGADGIEHDHDGSIYVSSWVQGKVWKLDPKGQNPVVIAEGFKSAADFYFDRDARKIVLPDMLAGTVTVIDAK